MEKIETRGRRVQGLVVNGRTIRAGAVVSNANLLGTIFKLVGEERWTAISSSRPARSA